MRVRAHRDPVSCRWAVPLPTIDALVVRRSASACEEYGSDFRYGHYADVGSAPAAAATMAGAAGVMALARIPPARAALLWLATAAEGPSVERRAKSWFRVRFVATAGPQTVVTSVSGGDPGYDETAKMLAESALSLARDDLPDRAGQLTPVQAMGPALLARLRRAGIRFDVHDTVPS
jgi:saccharopine dehydrogenase (NAD+, L-glutamate forming)